MSIHPHRTSFVGHLAGILVGLLYTQGPLQFIMKACAGFLTSIGYRARQINYYSSSGYSGYNGTRANVPSTQNEPPRAYVPRPGPHPYSAGLSEEEQYEAAVQASLGQRGSAAQERPAYGFHIPPEPEELRRRRLQRFDR